MKIPMSEEEKKVIRDETDNRLKDTSATFFSKLERGFEEAFVDENILNRLLIFQGYDPVKDIAEGLRFIHRLLLRRIKELEIELDEAHKTILQLQREKESPGITSDYPRSEIEALRAQLAESMELNRQTYCKLDVHCPNEEITDKLFNLLKGGEK